MVVLSGRVTRRRRKHELRYDDKMAVVAGGGTVVREW